jgi:hypothetical protein
LAAGSLTTKISPKSTPAIIPGDTTFGLYFVGVPETYLDSVPCFVQRTPRYPTPTEDFWTQTPAARSTVPILGIVVSSSPARLCTKRCSTMGRIACVSLRMYGGTSVCLYFCNPFLVGSHLLLFKPTFNL